MGKLQTYTRIRSSDFDQKDQQFVEKLTFSLNPAIDDMMYQLNGKISLTDNVYCTVKDIEITVNSSGVPINDTRMALNNPVPVIGTEVIKAECLDNSSVFPTGMPFISFTQITNGLRINHITGLTPGQRWRLKVVAFN